MVTNVLGTPHSNVFKATRGDVVLTDFKALGLVDDSGSKIACVTEKGLRKIPLSHAVKVWRV
jgi:hypothetical protein